MFVSMIASLVVMLVILSYMATSGIVSDANNVKVTYEKVKYIYSIEKSLLTATENLCQVNYLACKNKEVNGIIYLTLNDLVGYMPDNFDNSNFNGGGFTDIQILNNYSTFRLIQNIPVDIGRKIYLNHYQGREYGISPYCVSGDKNSAIPCNTEYVYHDYPTTLALRNALAN